MFKNTPNQMSVGVGCVYFTTCINIIKIREIYILNKIIASIYFKLNKLNHWCSLFVSMKDSNINRTLAGTQTHTGRRKELHNKIL